MQIKYNGKLVKFILHPNVCGIPENSLFYLFFVLERKKKGGPGMSFTVPNPDHKIPIFPLKLACSSRINAYSIIHP